MNAAGSLVIEGTDIRRRDHHLAAERPTGFKEAFASWDQLFDCTTFTSDYADGRRQVAYIDTGMCSITENQMKIINGERVALSTECVQREGRTMSYIDGSGLTTEEYLMPSRANEWRQNTQATRLIRLHPAPNRYTPPADFPQRGLEGISAG